MSDAMRMEGQDLKAYLLGAATTTETERFDELSIANDEFADALSAAEMDLIDSYVNGELSAVDRENFERRYLRSASQADRVVFADALQEYASGRLSANASVTTGVSTFFEWARRYFQFGLAAAALLLAITAGLLFLEYSKTADKVGETAAVHEDGINPPASLPNVNAETEESAAPAKDEVAPTNDKREPTKAEKPRSRRETPAMPESRVVALVLRPQMRSSGKLPEVAVPAGTGHVSARLELEPSDFRSYRVTLREQSSSRVLWQSGTLRAAGPVDARRLIALIPARVLNSGTYTLTVSGLSVNGSDEIFGDYAFRVVR